MNPVTDDTSSVQSEDVQMQEYKDPVVIPDPVPASIPLPAMELPMRERLKIRMVSANLAQDAAASRFMELLDISDKFKSEAISKAELSPAQVAKIIEDNEALVTQAQKDVTKADRDLSTILLLWNKYAPKEQDDMQWRSQSMSPEPSIQSMEEAVGAYVVKFNNANLYHCDIRRCLKEKVVPVFQNSEKIDFTRLTAVAFSDEPELKVNFLDKNDTDALQIVRSINRFLREFREFYNLHLGSLFKILASQYMKKAFRKAGIEAQVLEDTLVKMGKDLPTQLASLSEANAPLLYDYGSIDTWVPIEHGVREILRLNLLRPKAVTQLFALQASQFTDVHTYAARVELLMEATSLKSTVHESLILESLFAGLPDEGQRIISIKYPDPSDIPSVAIFLDLLRADSTQFPGRQTDWAHWVRTRFKSLGVGSKSQSSTSQASSKKASILQDSSSNSKRPRADKEKLLCTKERCNSTKHSHTQCYFLHPELRPQFKKPKASHGPVRATAAMRKGLAPLEPVNPRRLAAITKEINKIRSSSLDASLAEEMGVVSINKIAEFSRYIDEFDPTTPTKRLCAFRGAQEGDNRIAVKLTANGKELTAVLDSGSTDSYIDLAIAKELGVRIAKLPGPVELGEAGAKAENMITCDKLDLVCNERSVSCHVGVMNIPYYDFYIGIDLFPRLGYYIGGVRMPKPAPLPDIWIHDEDKPPIIPDEPPEEEKTEAFVKDKSKFLQDIQPLLDLNSAIDPKSHCDLEIMKVELKVPPDCKVYVKSRQFHAQTASAEVEQQILKWWDNGVIVPSPKGNPYNNSLTLSARRDLQGNVLKYRVCLDPRLLNKQLLQSDTFALPLISDILKKTAGHSYFSTLDLSQAFTRLPLAAESQPLTAFTYGGQQYMFARAPFGLKPMTSIFQRGMTYILGDLSYVCIYVDDIVIFSRTKEDHLQHVKIVIDRLTKAKLIINKEKSHFLCTQVVLLGFVIDKHGRRINPEKVANIKSWAPPTNGKMVQRYMGMFNHFRDYIPLYGTISGPLDALRNAKGNFLLNDLQQKSFDGIKDLIPHAPILSNVDWSLPIYAATDASNYGVAGMLYQLPLGEKDDSKINYIAFMARALQDHEKRYPAYKKELLGIIFTLRKFHYYLWGRRFTLFTDHKPLTFLMDQDNLNNILAEWKETIFSYDFQIVHRPGILNIIPDALSRAFPDELWEERKMSEIKASKKYNAAMASPQAETIDSADFALQMSPEGLKLAEGIQLPDKPFMHFTHEADDRQVPAKSSRKEILNKTHSFGHLGATAMVNMIHLDNMTWPRLKEDCVLWVKSCSSCQRHNIARKGYHPLKAIHAELPGEHLAIDLAQFPLSKDGNEYALLVVDICTRFVFLYELKTKDAASVSKRLFRLFCDIGFPKIIQSDNGLEFVNKIIDSLTKTLKIDHRLSTPYHPRGNGVAERHIKSMKDILRKSIEANPTDWDVHLPMVQLQMNSRIVSLHNSTPFSLFYGRAFPGISNFTAAESRSLSNEELEERLMYLTHLVFPALSELSSTNQKKMIDKFNKSHTIREIQPGTFVMANDPVAEGALTPKKDGPFKVTRKTAFGAYELQDATGEILPRHYAPEQLNVVTQDLDQPSQESYEVESILDHSDKDGKILYKVHWKGYTDDEDSYIPYESFDSDKLVHQYWKKINKTNPHVVRKQERKTLKTQKEELKRHLAHHATVNKQRHASKVMPLKASVDVDGILPSRRSVRNKRAKV